MKTSLKIFIITCSIFFATCAHAALFVEKAPYIGLPSTAVGESMVAQDFDGDGNMDLAVGGASGYIHIYFGDGTGQYATPIWVLTNAGWSSLTKLASADFNGDGKPDIAASYRSGFMVIMNNGARSFTAGVAGGSTPNTPLDLAIADINGDGLVDIVVAATSVYTFLGGGTGKFYLKQSLASVSADKISVADFNGDGLQDIAASSFTTGKVVWCRNKGAGVFATTLPPTIQTISSPSAMHAADLNNDGVQDLMVTSYGASAIYISLGSGLGPQPTATRVPTSYSIQPVSIATADFNSDGKIDIVTGAQNTYALTVQLGNGLGGFTYHSTYTTGANSAAYGLITADLDNNNTMDIAAANYGSAPALNRFLNQSDITAPTGSININNSAIYTTIASVTATFTCADNVACASMQLLSNGVWQATQAVSASLPWTFGTTNGTKSLSVRFFDAAGNVSPTYTRTIILDSVAPIAPSITSPGSNAVSKVAAYPTISGTSEANNSILLLVDGKTAGFTTASSLGVWSRSAAGTLVEGLHIFQTQATDPAGLSSPWSAAVAYRVDTIAPTLTVTPLVVTKEATAALTTVTLTIPTWSDTGSGIASGSLVNGYGKTLFPVATTAVNWSIKDVAGNTTTVLQQVVVQDTTAPIISLVGAVDIYVEAGSLYVDFAATSSDAVDGAKNITAVGNVNIAVVGVNTLTYDITDKAGNAAAQVIRRVHVQDTIVPVIALTGLADVYVEAGAVYADAGAISTDYVDGNSNVVAVGTVNIAKVGTYTLTYNTTDAAGNAAAPVIRRVHVQDTTAPVITLTGLADVYVEAGIGYTDAGATAVDIVDGNSNVVAVGTVNIAKVGTYTLTYNITDAAGNVATQVVRRVHVQDTTAPVITLVGLADIYVEAGAVYTDAGAKAADIVDGNSNIVAVGTVNTATLGVYALTYDITDAAGNVATQVVRRVHVQDTTAPVITLTGLADVYVEAGVGYTDAGATSADVVDGNKVVTAVGAANTALVGVYTLTYDITDAAGNAAAQVIRRVHVQDTIAPVIALTGLADVYVEAGAAYIDAGATAVDTVDGNSNVVAVGTVNIATVGTYTLTYDITDKAGNAAAQVIRRVHVQDTTAPVITLTGLADVYVEAGAAYIDAGAKAADIVDGNSNIVAVGTVNIAKVGTYTLTYNITDAAGNVATQVVRRVHVQDTTAPVITLTGQVDVYVQLGTIYADAGAKAVDIIDGNSNVTAVGVVNTALLGTYTLTYDITDVAGNIAVQVIRRVHVQDGTAPVITLTGLADVYVEAGTTYVDAGATAVDAVDGNSNVIAVGTVNTALVGVYTLTYDITDTAGNVATQVIRRVHVQDTTAPVMSLVGAADVYVNVGAIYTDAGATAADFVDGNSNVAAVGTVNTGLVGVYTLTYAMTDAAGNAATPLLRRVHVQDTLAPVFNALPLADTYVEATAVNTIYTAALPTWTDSSSVVLSSNAPASFPLGKTVITWTATDAYANVATAQQSVIVQDTTVPVFAGTVLADVYASTSVVSLAVGLVTPTVTDIFPLTVTNNAPALFPVGTTVVIWTAVDANGNRATRSQRVLVASAVVGAPAIASTAPQGTVTTKTIPTLTGTADPYAVVTIYNQGKAVGTTTANGNGLWSFTPVLPAGKQSITVTATNAAGGQSAPSQPWLITVAQAAPTMTSPTVASVFTGNVPAMTGTADPYSLISIFDQGVLIGTTTANAAGAWTFTPSLATGNHSLTTTATGASGIASAPSQPWNLILAGGASPAVPMFSSNTAAATFAAGAVPALTGIADPYATITIFDQGVAIGTVTANGQGQWSFQPALTAGNHVLTATSTNVAGKVSAASLPWTLIVSGGATPATPALGNNAAASVLTNTNQTITGIADPYATITILDQGIAIGTVTANGQGNWSFNTTLTPGNHTITTTATNPAGVTSATSVPWSVVVAGGVIPATPVVTSPTVATVSAAAIPALTGIADPYAVITIYDQGKVIGTTTANAQGNWTIVPTLPVTTHVITTTATNTAGKVSAASAPWTFTLVNNANITTATIPDMTGTAAPFSVITIYDNNVKIATTTADAQGSWTYKPSLPSGQHSLTSVATSPAGIVSSAVTPWSFIITAEDAVPLKVDVSSTQGGCLAPVASGQNWLTLLPMTLLLFAAGIPALRRKVASNKG